MSKSTALSASEIMMRDINVDEALWASSMLPEGIVERWFIADGRSSLTAILWRKSELKTPCTRSWHQRAVV